MICSCWPVVNACTAEEEVCLKTRNRKILILFSFALSLSVGRVWAETTHGGTISNEETWTLADSPHRVVSWLTLTGKVTIEPGATVTINEPGMLGVTGSGSLWAVGTPDKPIRFTSMMPGNYISIDAVSPSEFRYCHFSGVGNVSVNPPATVPDRPSHLFQHCLFQTDVGLYLNRSATRVLNSTFVSLIEGIYVTVGNSSANEIPTIRHNVIKGGGIIMYAVQGGAECGGEPFIQDNRITGKASLGIYTDTYAPINGLVIADCSFDCASSSISKLGNGNVELTVQGCDLVPQVTVEPGSALGSSTFHFANNYWGVTNAALVDARLFAGALDEAAFTPFATNSCFRQADVDGSAFGNATGLEDATLVKEHLVGLRQLSAAQQEIADVDNDGDVDVRDALMIESFVKGTLWRLPVR